MKDFYIYQDRVEIILSNFRKLVIYFTADSSKVFFRYKINTITNVRHPGIFLGVDNNGCRWFMHNHYENGRPSIVPESKFTKNQPIYLMQEAYINSPIQIITNGLQQVLAGESYSWINYNCQSYVNRATNNSHASEAVEKWAGGIAFSLLLLIGAKAFSNSK